jgi:uncharacterized surface protein with fasciclin (FAS1) repeats
MKKLILSLMALAAFTFSYAQKTTAEYIIKTKKLSTLESALISADLMSTMQATGPFTLFAPTNDAFNMLSPGVLGNLLITESHDKLVALLKYHVVSGLWTTKAIVKAIELGSGKAELRTVNGNTITAVMVGKKIKLTDETGHSTYIKSGNKKTTNGYIHTINGVLMLN